MSAIITVLKPEGGDSVQMYVNAEEKVEEVIERCIAYWQIEGDVEDYDLVHNDARLISSKTVISSDIQGGEVLRLCERKEDVDEAGKDLSDEESSEKDVVVLAKEWLEKNIGLDTSKIELISRDKMESGTHLLFENIEAEEEYYTVIVEQGQVKKYIPAVVDYAEFGEV